MGVNSSSLTHIFLTEGVGAMFNQLKLKDYEKNI